MKGHLRYLRISPRKVRLATDLIKGKKVEKALKILDFTIKKASSSIKKLLASVVANAKENFDKEAKNLFVKKIIVTEGPKLKRFRPRAKGRAFEIQKKTSHITIELGEIVKEEKVLKQNKKETQKVKKTEKSAKEKKIIRKQKINF